MLRAIALPSTGDGNERCDPSGKSDGRHNESASTKSARHEARGPAIVR